MREIPPSANLIVLNVNGPTYSIALRCATNANPHIIAVIRSSKFDFIVQR